MSHRGKSSLWMRRHVEDAYVKRARKDGVRSRSAYKLEEVLKKHKIIRPHHIVVDLGSSPGGWSQCAAKYLGPSGHLIAIDLLHMDMIDNVTFIQGDFTHSDIQEALIQKIKQHARRDGSSDGKYVNVVLSDMMHNMTGHKQTDHFRSMDLVYSALDFAKANLIAHSSSTLFLKLLRGEDEEAFIKDTRRIFDKIQVLKPDASRKESAEIYVLARGKKV